MRDGDLILPPAPPSLVLAASAVLCCAVLFCSVLFSSLLFCSVVFRQCVAAGQRHPVTYTSRCLRHSSQASDGAGSIPSSTAYEKPVQCNTRRAWSTRAHPDPAPTPGTRTKASSANPFPPLLSSVILLFFTRLSKGISLDRLRDGPTWLLLRKGAPHPHLHLRLHLHLHLHLPPARTHARTPNYPQPQHAQCQSVLGTSSCLSTACPLPSHPHVPLRDSGEGTCLLHATCPNPVRQKTETETETENRLHFALATGFSPGVVSTWTIYRFPSSPPPPRPSLSGAVYASEDLQSAYEMDAVPPSIPRHSRHPRRRDVEG